MDKVPAACAVDWSIQLEKSLRSKKPGKSVEALKEIGCRLEWWNSEPELTCAQYRMFGLIPGEDKLFLNAIFLRLADTFRLGDKQIRNGIVKLFLRMKRKKKRDGEGILSKCNLENYLEVLSRVKEVFDRGDVEERALALVLFGCWADFTKDCPDIRYIVLSGLVSADVLEVKAALFAAKCLCERSDDFANVFLEILNMIVLSPEVSRGVKLAGGRAFARMCCSFALADKAYKTGLKLLMDSSDDDFSAVMIISLSIIASRWMLLISTQIELLTLFLSEERSLHMQATSLRCHRFILAKGICSFTSTTETVHKLFSILHRSEFQPTLQDEALRILHKILVFNLSIIPCTEMPGLFLKVLAAVKTILRSPIVSTRVLAISVLADLSRKFLERANMVSGGTGSTLALQAVSSVLDEILLLITPNVDLHEPDFAAKLEVKSLLNTLFNLVEEHPHLCCLVLNNLCLFIDRLMKMLDTGKIVLSNHKTLVESKLMLCVSKVAVACLQNLNDTDIETSQVLDALKLQAENICHCSYFGNNTSVTYFLLLHMHATYICMQRMTEELMSLSRISSLSFVDSILQLDKSTVDCAKKILGSGSYWSSYKAGKTAACQGAWCTASFIFEQLMTKVQTASSSCWLKSLAQLSNSEKQMQLFLLPDQGDSVFPSESNAGERGSVAFKINNCNYIENLLRACNTLLSAEEILTVSDAGHVFRFQRWFLTLRAKALKTVVDMMKLLDSSSLIRDGAPPYRQLERHIVLPCTTSDRLGSLICSFMEVSCRMNKLAREFDLLLTSFTGMDRQSVMSVSALALSCSLMAFTAGFAFLVPNLHSADNCSIFKSGKSETFHAMVIEDLVGRLRHIDSKTTKKLLFLLNSFQNYKGCFFPRFQSQVSSTSYEARFMHKLSEYSIGEIFRLQNEATTVGQHGDYVSQFLNNGSQLLLNVISKLMLIPFRTPHHFFCVRPAVSAELFVMNEDGVNVDGSSILSGIHLSLSLCLQLKNIPAVHSSPITKAYCILNCNTHSHITTEIGEHKGQAQSSVQDKEIVDMVELNEQLMRYVIGSADTHGLHSRGRANDRSMVTEYVCFELNERGQGFSTCLLDVSSFPEGSYRMKWHSCIDNEGSYWSLLSLNDGPLFTVHNVC
ncbi:hypothetical protein BUALT_Bualt03G0032300 [Buddleja alternifolia]|uniref:Integrator complex subunit 7 n=1 Tax=Buddleja alternifolia TaxID=168488 RepID=A0AAV6XZ42_9LAMI|nr:hypothetical protein BUALT_Bualt03G0032300 [Buddleja alternifolia]